MAKPIKETPILTGRDAVNFFASVKKSEQKKIDKAELERIKRSSEKLKSIEHHAPSPESKEVESVPVKSAEGITDFDRQRLETYRLQKLQPDNNEAAKVTSPIEVIKNRLEELEACKITVDGYPLAMGIISAQINELNHILKLIQ